MNYNAMTINLQKTERLALSSQPAVRKDALLNLTHSWKGLKLGQ